MIVAAQTFHIILIAIAVLICLKALYTRFITKQGNKDDWMVLLLLILVPINWYTPTVLTISDCNQYTKEVVLFPGQRAGISYTYGRKNYIINQSKRNLKFEYLFYGDNRREEGQVDQLILPENVVIVNEVTISYLFEAPEKSVSTKSSGATKTLLYCLAND
ncbi:hypothetical protein PBAL39_00475 [Pedobacter sp. BAL39]|uniref:hypothetical protein n=1 Tax=Pedobacter sp. BAL39 TaxID=391596 RepID=UPI000155925E|nr:hypothetical protein [Pedobacter sp. BAL39]EDM34961.1 hypothetical protein PBAL39_00475 [Pedobacter sp. BAL39]